MQASGQGVHVEDVSRTKTLGKADDKKKPSKMTNDHKSGTPSPQNNTGSKSAVNSIGRPPTTSILRSALYYQNRIIIPEKKRSPTQTTANAPNEPRTISAPNAVIGSGAKARPTSLQQNSNSAIFRPATNASASISNVRTIQGNNVPLADDTMDTAGIDIVVTDTENNQHRVKKKKSIFKRFYLCLQDNRMKGEPNAEEILASSNPQEYRILKKVLNTTFLSVGIALLVAVLIVIIYSSIDS
ncbi:uncharacterized protein LOC128549511 isoform X2 [Mercenaria mercenaria]|uniref:uncharacterized protein LOC128549511 isoform X2 n=1 Tax=Mercenaria mercenaria TaxID=6596 RepID=UPI00234F1B31|nr:uncharacterized protein LOC128549511 isoform X2 [Mercenaria mercenaria]